MLLVMVIDFSYRYMEAHRRCKIAEETIDSETVKVKEFSKSVEDKVMEVYS